MAKEVLEMEVKSNIGDVAKDTDKLATASGKAEKGVGKIGKAFKGMGTAMKAAGIGLVVALFVTLKEALERNQKVMNAVNTVMTTVSTTFNQVADVLVDVYNWVTKSSDRFDGLTKVISGLMTIALTPLKLAFYSIKLGVEGAMLAWEDSFLGGGDEGKIAALRVSMAETANDIKEVGLAAIDAGKDIGNNIGDAIGEIGAIGEMAIDGISKISIKSNYELAKATTAAQNSSKLAEAQIQGLIEKNDLLSETQRQIRDDETKTFAERIAANKELGDILDKQEEEMLKLADTRVASAKLELDANKDNIELQVAYQQTLNDRAGVEAQVAGFRSEQLTNEVSLNKELLESQKEIRAEGLSGLQRELEELKTAYELKKEMARKSGMDTTAITEQYEGQKTETINKNIEEQKEAQRELSEYKAELLKQGIDIVAKMMEVQSVQLEKDYNKEIALAEANGDDLEGIEKKFEGKRREQAKKMKAMKIAMALVDTYQSAVSAYAAGLSVGGPAGLVLGPISAGLAVTAGLANVAMIEKQPLGGGGGGAGGTAAGGGANTPAPQMMSGAFDISGGVAPEATKAYVVTDEMTNSQNQLANIRRRATI